jgi:hypothetical protein
MASLALGALAACGVTAMQEHAQDDHAPTTSPRGRSAPIRLLYMGSEDLLPALRAQLDDGERIIRFDRTSLTEDYDNRSWEASVELPVPDTVRVRVALVGMGAGSERDTAASLSSTMPILPSRGYRLYVTVGRERPYGHLNDVVVAAPVRDARGRRAGDTLYVAWGEYIVPIQPYFPGRE